MNNKTRNFLTVVPAAAVLLIASQVSLSAKTWCTNADLLGSYGLLGGGAVLQPANSPLAGPFARVATVVFDGAGNAVVPSGYDSINGNVLSGPSSGTYTVSSNCTANVSLKLGPPVNLVITLTGTLQNDGKDFSFLITNPPGTSVSGIARPQNINWCTTASFRGDFGFDMNGGFVVGPLDGPFKRIGKFTADGNGAFSAVTTANYGGRIATEDFAGAYTVDAA
ncbi:MAG: hypothetical protein ABIZ80_01415 [Bryobacteraceae bacterium]